MMNLIEYRKEFGLTQTEMANLLGVTQGLIGHFETGRRVPGPQLAIEIEKRTGGKVSKTTLRPDIFTSTAA